MPPPLPPSYVGFWARLVASLIDTVFLAVITLPPLVWIYGWAYFDLDPTKGVSGPAEVLIAWVLPVLLIIAFWRWKEATPGKMVFSAKIVDATTGAPPTLERCVLRYLGYFLSTIPFGLGFLWIAFDPRKQGWHDKIANTVVVRASPASVPPELPPPAVP